MTSVELPTSGAFDPLPVPWAAWRPNEAAHALAGVAAPWYVAGGWAIDLFLGEQTREHDDLEIGVPAARFDEVADVLGGLELFVIGPDLASPLPNADEESGPALATPFADAGALLKDCHQTWALERTAACWRLDVFREPSDGDTWVSRRDGRIRLPYDELIERTADGIPYACPEIVLLFKAKVAREKDDDDLAAVLPRLPAGRRGRLASLLARAHPGHRWLAELN